MKKNFLSPNDYIKLHTYLVKHDEEYVKNAPLLEDIATAARNDLGIPSITVNHLRRLITDPDSVLKYKGPKSAKAVGLKERVERLERIVQELLDRE